VRLDGRSGIAGAPEDDDVDATAKDGFEIEVPDETPVDGGGTGTSNVSTLSARIAGF
jgi:hypothetical protein